jgi:hypothetical protein
VTRRNSAKGTTASAAALKSILALLARKAPHSWQAPHGAFWILESERARFVSGRALWIRGKAKSWRNYDAKKARKVARAIAL